MRSSHRLRVAANAGMHERAQVVIARAHAFELGRPNLRSLRLGFPPSPLYPIGTSPFTARVCLVHIS